MSPISRRELIRKFRALGFEGPISGGRHSFMQAGITFDEWEKA
jgi:hypothetical protein